MSIPSGSPADSAKGGISLQPEYIRGGRHWISDEAGVTIVKTTDSRHFFVTCHPEYDADTLAQEYYRDLGKGMNPAVPANYFPDDNPENPPIVNWRSTGQLLYLMYGIG